MMVQVKSVAHNAANGAPLPFESSSKAAFSAALFSAAVMTALCVAL
jgi:hypothetical protein